MSLNYHSVHYKSLDFWHIGNSADEHASHVAEEARGFVLGLLPTSTQHMRSRKVLELLEILPASTQHMRSRKLLEVLGILPTSTHHM